LVAFVPLFVRGILCVFIWCCFFAIFLGVHVCTCECVCLCECVCVCSCVLPFFVFFFSACTMCVWILNLVLFLAVPVFNREITPKVLAMGYAWIIDVFNTMAGYVWRIFHPVDSIICKFLCVCLCVCLYVFFIHVFSLHSFWVYVCVCVYEYICVLSCMIHVFVFLFLPALCAFGYLAWCCSMPFPVFWGK